MGTAGEGEAVKSAAETAGADAEAREAEAAGENAGSGEVGREPGGGRDTATRDGYGEPGEGAEVLRGERGSRRVHVGSGNPEAVQRDTVGVGVEERALHSSCAQLCRPGNAEDCAGGE